VSLTLINSSSIRFNKTFLKQKKKLTLFYNRILKSKSCVFFFFVCLSLKSINFFIHFKTTSKKMNILLLIFGYLTLTSPVWSLDINKTCIYNQNCRLPQCNCASTNIPFNINSKYRLDQIPQLVVLTVDDDKLNIQSYQMYKRLLESFKNPNGLPIRMTFFLSDTKNETSYCLVKSLYDNYQEIATSTFDNTCPDKLCSVDKHYQSWSYKKWAKQLLSMRSRLIKFSNIPSSEIVGFRAPTMVPSADIHYRMLMAKHFIYDSSLIINDFKKNNTIIWPYTLDYPSNLTIDNNGPVDAYPGLWELPVFKYKLGNSSHFCWIN
jgi:hypothetical protein